MSSGFAAGPGFAEGADRAAQLLSSILQRSPRERDELAAELVIGSDELEPALVALERHGLVALDSSRESVRPGPAALRFARSDHGLVDLVELAHAGLRRLASESGETANLILLRDGGTEAVAQVDGVHLLGATNWVGRPLGLHATAAGKVFLAFGAAQLGPGELERLTPQTVTDPAQLDAELATVRERGYATIAEELEPGLSAVAAPIREAGGSVIGVLCVSGAALRLPRHRLELLGRVTVEQADEISQRLGSGPDDPRTR